ncbi:hypothetical protein RND71_005339 [Anisodus tanguticus]|uniref:BHLH domain-containing protein n=1 Tax=Anisodus tanguticus TaxID=243964 RepID=A0AAE1VMK1_9SOLA|nr:hypothetical protein RND71_005339 [Anisodus tanguticus]
MGICFVVGLEDMGENKGLLGLAENGYLFCGGFGVVLGEMKWVMDGASDVDRYMTSNNNMQNQTENISFTQNFTELAENNLFLQPCLVDNTSYPSQAALRKNLANNSGGNMGDFGGEIGQKRKWGNGEELDDVSFDGCTLSYDSDELVKNGSKVDDSDKNGGNSSNATSIVTGGNPKGKKKRLPAKNLMAERQRRKKLNDRLYMLMFAVPRIVR